MKIVTEYIRPPIPTTKFDWMAYVDDGDENAPKAYGPTEREALHELAETLATMMRDERELYAIVERTAAHFDGTDAPLGIDARAALAKARGEA